MSNTVPLPRRKTRTAGLPSSGRGIPLAARRGPAAARIPARVGRSRRVRVPHPVRSRGRDARGKSRAGGGTEGGPGERKKEGLRKNLRGDFKLVHLLVNVVESVHLLIVFEVVDCDAIRGVVGVDDSRRGGGGVPRGRRGGHAEFEID